MATPMNQESPFEIVHVPAKLRELFTCAIPEAKFGTADEKDKNFLSRALAAYSIYKLTGCTLEDAANSVVDGGGDGGIDCIYYSPASHYLWVVQSKYISEGIGEPSLGDVAKFKTGLENLLQGNWDVFQNNASFTAKIPQIQAVFDDPTLQIRAILVYSGLNTVSEDRIRLFEDLKRRFSQDSEYLSFKHYNLTSIHDWITGADENHGVKEIQLIIRKPGWIKDPYETIYGFIPIEEIASHYSTHGKKIIAANIRAYKGNTEVNQKILQTIRDEPSNFFYLNNGLTAYCQRLEVNNLDRPNADSKRIKAFGFSIVNGAQTMGCITKYFTKQKTAPAQGNVFIKIISLERCADNILFAQRISRSTNFQNEITSRDFVSLDEQQDRIARQLELSHITYHYKDEEGVVHTDSTNFTLIEATTAAACIEQQSDCDFCARCLSNRRSLWSFDPVYPPENLYRSRYERIFRPDRSARTIWRAVQTQRIVIEVMQANARSSIGIRKSFFESARWLILNLIFLKLHPEQGEELELSGNEVSSISTKTIDFAEILWTACETHGLVTRASASVGSEQYQQTRHFRSVFSDSADCQRLRNSVLSSI